VPFDVEAFLASKDHTDPGKHGQTDHPTDEVHDSDQPPPGWKQQPDGSYAPPGWVKKGDSWEGKVP